MAIMEYEGGMVEVDDEGFLANSNDWNEKIASVIAEKEGQGKLTEDRLEIIKFMRDYYKKYQFFPILDSVCLNLHKEKECVKHRFIEPLVAWKIAGLPKPNPQVVGYLKGLGGVV